MVTIRRFQPRRSVRTALPPAACPPASRDAGRAAAGRAGSFNSGENVTIFPVVEVRRTGTGKNVVLLDGTKRPARRRPGPFFPFESLSTSPQWAHMFPACSGSGNLCFKLCFAGPSIFRCAPAASCLCAFHVCRSRPSWKHPPAPAESRTPARHAHACHAPSGSAAGALRHSTP
jgi:hypothetical protein